MSYLFAGEVLEDRVRDVGESSTPVSDEEINQKYAKGESRLILEQGSLKIKLFPVDLFQNLDIELQPEYQRRLVWDDVRKSLLIESLIMNIPIPPIFLYETKPGQYEVLDGLQRMSTIKSFYADGFRLKGLTEWKSLDGRTYSELPDQVKKGIDRRQINTITVLNESVNEGNLHQDFRQLVFARLNTGGVKLNPQELRNALYTGAFNDLCVKLSEHATFRALLGLSGEALTDFGEEEVAELEEDTAIEADGRMKDVELVLRYFAMRHLDSYNANMSEFLDRVQKNGNAYSEELLKQLENAFKETLDKANTLFGKNVFCKLENNKLGGKPQRFIYDPMMVALTRFDVANVTSSQAENTEKLEEFYRTLSDDSFMNSRKQNKVAIENRVKQLTKFLEEKING